jgi:hypothetical protein
MPAPRLLAVLREQRAQPWRDCRPPTELVQNFIQAFYLGEDELLEWLKTNHHVGAALGRPTALRLRRALTAAVAVARGQTYTLRQLTQLIQVTNHKKPAKQKLVKMAEELKQ